MTEQASNSARPGTAASGPEPVAGRARTDSLAGEAALEHVRAVTAASGSSFYWGMRILPRPRRDAMYAIYAFCREVDDIADGPETQARKLVRLDEWRAEIGRLFAGMPESPPARALLGPVRAFGLKRADFLAVIDGVEMDARQVMRAPSMAELEQYCARVAGAVGLLSIRAFGDGSPHARSCALALGQALQFTNILRDLHEDAERGRLYLPRELLLAHGIAATDPQTVLRHPALPAVCADIAAVARERFEEAAAAIAHCDRRALKPAMIMMMIYRRILDRLVRRGWQRLDEPVEVARPEKIWIAFRYGIL